MIGLLDGYYVTLTDDRGGRNSYKMLWGDSILNRIGFWRECADVTKIEVTDACTGEVMYTYDDSAEENNEYICPDWRGWLVGQQLD